MDIEQLRDYCIKKKGVTEEFPFDNDTLVFKVMGKMFALASLTEKPFSVNLKMNIEIINDWREKYDDIQPGYHMNKKMWNTVMVGNGNISAIEFYWMIEHSYDEVIKGLPKKVQEQLKK